MAALEKDYENDDRNFEPVKVSLPIKGTVETLCVATWKGYFQNLLSINIEPVSPVGKRRVEF
jgi:hypothetical protein